MSSSFTDTIITLVLAMAIFSNSNRILAQTDTNNVRLQDFQIIFTSDRSGHGNLYAISLNNNGIKRITNVDADDWNATPAPNGSAIVFTSNRGGIKDSVIPGDRLFGPGADQRWASDLYLIKQGEEKIKRLTFGKGRDESPSWSPDGSHIAFSSERDFDYEIYTIASDGTSPNRLTYKLAFDLMPAWSPEGSKIVFISNRGGISDSNIFNYDIYVMDIGGTNIHQLTSTQDQESNPKWSPDGSKIVFTASPAGKPMNIFVMNADGSSRQQLTDDPEGNTAPSWSPDGSHIAFTSYRDGNAEIYVMNADGNAQKRLTNDSHIDNCPAWLIAHNNEWAFGISEADTTNWPSPSHSMASDYQEQFFRQNLIGHWGLTADSMEGKWDTIEISNFNAVASRQKKPFWCWAACLQILLNHSGIAIDQEDIVEMIKGEVVDATATSEEILRIRGWHLGHDAKYGTWSIDCTHSGNFSDSTLSTTITLGTLADDRVLLVGLDHEHVEVLYRATYQYFRNGSIIDSVTLFDPLSGHDETMSWTKIQKRVSAWWACYATRPMKWR